MIEYPTTHWLIYAHSGAGKSTMAATFPTPMLVLLTDPLSKAMPYRRRGIKGKSSHLVTAEGYEHVGGAIPYEVINDKEGDPKIKIERYVTPEVKGGDEVIYAYENLLWRLPLLHREVAQGKWKTVVFDSLTAMEYEVRKLHQYKLNPTANSGKQQDARQWYGASAMAIEELCFSQLTSLDTNVVLLAHVKREEDSARSTYHFSVAAPGAQGTKLPACFGEVYHLTRVTDQEVPVLQTHATADYLASTQIGAPNMCEPTYEALWANYFTDIDADVNAA